MTAWWVLLIISIFLGFVIYLIYITKHLSNNLKKITESFSEESILSNKLFASVWNDYSHSFIEIEEGKRTDEYSYEYFNESNILSKSTNLKLINSIPNILVGLGILGTFIGLTYGISNFQTESTEQIKESIETLLAGMGTAFITSLYGMLLSLIFTVVEKIQVNSLHNSLHRFCYRLDRSYRITKEEERILELRRQETVLSDYFIFTDEHNNKVKPANLFRDLYEESRKQSEALQSFSTDLANLIEAGFEKILNDPDQGVTHELRCLKSEIENLGNKLQDPTTEMTQNIVKNLEASMSKMMEEFSSAVSGSTKSDLEHLSSMLSQAGSSLTDLPGKLQEMTENLGENFRGLQDVVEKITTQTLSQSENVTDRMRGQVDEMSEIIKERMGELQVGQEVLMGRQSENLHISDRLLSSFNNSIEKMNGLSAEVTNSISKFSKVQVELNSVSGQLRHISDNVVTSTNTFKNAQNEFSQHSNDFIRKNSETIQEIQKSLTKAKEVSADYADKFSVIENGLQNIFEQIEEGINNYRDTVGGSLETFLSKYSEALTNTASSLEGASTKQEEILEELTEQLSKLQMNRVKV